ncbi:type I methionyl aminopeptidase [Acinetobacter larvae]|uniref:Methionine aminopeptidase n=1 Tax=Acinetobacter larvae TaxID=1789224 RepID=A0A1B2M010_9GAMM|nr:type I methionyl aminopeptidase [Acinetobacter larvae]AOA58534.1 type I methionyl aminopeptidase [Acinetobacter larvae]
MIKNAKEIQLMRESCRLLSLVFAQIDQLDLTGMSTLAVNDLVERYIVDVLKARPASKGQYGFAYVLNSSINEVVCHGVPSAQDILKTGDIVNFDITLEKNGYIADSSKMYCVGPVSAEAKRLVDTTYAAMCIGIAQVKAGARLGDIGHAIESYARQHGYSVVRDYCGHGIGRKMHEEPSVLHFGSAHTGMILQAGMTFTIEPMLNQGKRTVYVRDDGWTVVTHDQLLSAQFEHTVLVTQHGVEVLTRRPEESFQHLLGHKSLVNN